MKNDEMLPAVVSIGQMCRLLSLSRARFYSLTSVSDISRCFFLPPIYSLENKRPYYSQEMAQQNMDFKRNNTGWNQKVLLFYHPRGSVSSVLKAKLKKTEKQIHQSNDRHSGLREGLKCLGMSDITAAQIDAALPVCFPNGCQDVDDAEKLRLVFRYFKQQNSEHKQRT
jgi:hypothetical protein